MKLRVLLILACAVVLLLLSVPAAYADDLYITGVTPNTGGTGSTVSCLVQGSFFHPLGSVGSLPEFTLTRGMVTIYGYDVSLAGVQGLAARVTFSIPAAAPAGLYDLNVEQWALGVPYYATRYSAFLVTQWPIITSVDPASATAGSAALSITVTGINFMRIYAPLPRASVLSVNGSIVPTTVVSETKLTATIPAAQLASVGTLQLVVINTGTKYDPETQSPPFAFLVKAPAAPAVTSVSPTTVWAGYVKNDLVLTLTGGGFVSGARIALNGADKANTTFVSGTQLTVPLAAADIATAGTISVGAKNPPFPPGTPSATSIPLTVQAETSMPAVTIAGADTGWHNSPVALTFSATDSQSGVQKIQYMSAPAVPAWTDGASYTVPTSAQGAISVTVQALDWCNNVGTAAATVNIDTTQPGTQALGNVSVKKGNVAKLKFRVTEPAGLSPTADVVIKVNSGTSTVKTLTVNDATVNADRTATFTCNLKKGTYKWYVYATDLAGNTQANVANAKLTVK